MDRNLGIRECPYLIGRDDDSDAIQYTVPNPLLAPMLHIIGTEQQPSLNGGDLRSNNLCLLSRQRNIRGEKPNKLRQEYSARFQITCHV